MLDASHMTTPVESTFSFAHHATFKGGQMYLTLLKRNS